MSKDLSGDPDQEIEFRTKAGMAAPLVELRIVDPDMNDVAHDGKSSAPTAQVAVRQAKQLADNILRAIRGEPTAAFSFKPLSSATTSFKLC